MGFYAKKTDNAFRRQLDKEVDRLEIKKLRRQKSQRTKARQGRFGAGALSATVVCTQCERKMSKHTGDQQVKNNRENAPICVPCILGKPRTEKPKLYQRFSDIKK